MLALMAAAGTLAAAARAAAPEAVVSPAPRGLFLLVYAMPLQPAAQAWAAYRAGQGWHVVTRALGPAVDDDAARHEMQAAIRQHYQTWRDASTDEPSAGAPPSAHRPFVVMVLGDATSLPGPAGPAAGIPAWKFEQTEPTIRDRRDRFYATDDPYQQMDDDAKPDVALGRVPARTVDQALALLEKIKAHEADQSPGEWRSRLVYVAGEGHFGAIDLMLEGLFKQMVQRFVPARFDVTMTYAKCGSAYCPPPSQLTPTVLAQLGQPALLFNYVGHGHPTGLDALHWGGRKLRMLDAADLAALECAADDGAAPPVPRGRPIALMTCCSTGWYDWPDGTPSLAEAMLFHPCGPLAVIAGSRPTHPYANALHQKNVTQRLLAGEIETVGALDLLASRALLEPDETDRQLEALTQPLALAMQWRSTPALLRAMHVRLYNLLGDPATAIARPLAVVRELALDGSTIHGIVQGMSSGTARISVETARVGMARAGELATVLDDDPALDAKAAHNYPLANQRRLGVLETQVVDGRFQAPLDWTAWPGAGTVRVYVLGHNGSGVPVDGFGALDLPAGAVDMPSRQALRQTP